MSVIRENTFAGTVPLLRASSETGPRSLRHEAGEFESMLLNQWLQSAESTFASVPGADDEDEAGDAQIKEFAVQALARGIVAAGGIGISAMVERNLEKTRTAEVSNSRVPSLPQQSGVTAGAQR